MVLEGGLPDLLRFFLCSLHPQHLAQMGGDFRVGVQPECLLQITEPLIDVTHAVMHPPQAIHYVGIIGGKRDRFFYEFQRLR